MAAFDLMVALATGCLPNLKLIAEMLTEMFYSDKDDAILDWEYLPPVGPRPHNGFVGKFVFTNHRWRCCLIQIF
jgi:ubiquitin carboxyl-terminal hydrolase 9/24